MKNIDEKIQWIQDYMQEDRTHKHLDILNSDFVNDYIEKFNVKYKLTYFGAFKCAELGKVLNEGYKRGVFERHSQGLNNGAWMPGFPKWVYVYSDSGA